MIKYLLLKAILFLSLTNGFGQLRTFIERSTDALFLVNPATGFLGSLALEDYHGTKQVIIGAAVQFTTSYVLKYTVKKERPDRSNTCSFPSAHTSISFHGAAFIHQRYGFKYAIPAYILSSYVAWGRIYADKHDIWDVLGGAAIGTISGYIFTSPYMRKNKLTFAPALINRQYPGFHVAIRL